MRGKKDNFHVSHYIADGMGISCVGKMDRCGMDRYVEDLLAYIGEKSTPNMLLIEVMTVRDYFSINFMQSGGGEGQKP